MATPYPFIVFSWVCHYWRLVLLDEVALWKTVVIKRRDISPIFLEEFIRRSQNAFLEIMVQRNDQLTYHARNLHRFPTVANRIKTFHLYTYWDLGYYPSPSVLSNSPYLFPSLENIFCHPISCFFTDVDFVIPLVIQPQLKAMQVSVRYLGSLAIPGLFRELCLLSLSYDTHKTPLLSLLEALGTLPNLRALHLIGSPQPDLKMGAEDFKPLITLNELTVLISNCPILHLVEAPKLSHLDLLAYYSAHSATRKGICDHLCGFDFSSITHIRFDKNRGRITGNPTYEWKDSENIPPPCWSSSIDYRHNHSLKWVFDEFPAFYFPNQFHLSFGDVISTFVFVSYLEKAINIVEITLTGFNFSSLNHATVNRFSNALRNATTVRTLTIPSGSSLMDVCNLLSDGGLLPGLERLCYTYTASYGKGSANSYLDHCLRTLGKERFEMLKPLEIELSNFALDHGPQEHHQMQNMGLQLIRQGDKFKVLSKRREEN